MSIKEINKSSVTGLLKRDTNLTVLWVITFAVILTLALLLGNRFFSVNNFQSMSFQISEFGFFALAMSLAMLTGGIDLSIVANAGLSGVIMATIMSGKVIAITDENSLLVMVFAIAVALIVSTAGGLINGILVAKLSVPPILATLGTMILYNGMGMVLSNGESVGVKVEAFSDIGIKTVFGIPVIFIMLVITLVVVSTILSRTGFGKKIYLLGENQAALRFSGVDTEKVLIETYGIIGFLIGIAAVIMVSRINSARIGFGETYQLQAILVAVLAGFDPDGGRGKVIGVVLGMTVLQFLQSAFTIFNFSPYSKKLVWGAMLLIVMIINYFLNRERKLKVKKSAKIIQSEVN